MVIIPGNLLNKLSAIFYYISGGKCLFAAFFLSLPGYGQTLSLGVKLNPAFTAGYASGRSVIDREHFKIINFRPGIQLGAVAAITLKKFIVSYSIVLGSKKTGLLFTNFASPNSANYTRSLYKTAILYNKFSFGRMIAGSDKPFYRIYVLANIGLDINTVRKESGSGNITSPVYYTFDEALPPYPTDFIGGSAGLSFKLRSRCKAFGLFDIGITYDHAFYLNPPITIIATIEQQSYYTSLAPVLDYVSLDFTFYLKIRKNANGWSTISYKDYQ